MIKHINYEISLGTKHVNHYSIFMFSQIILLVVKQNILVLSLAIKYVGFESEMNFTKVV